RIPLGLRLDLGVRRPHCGPFRWHPSADVKVSNQIATIMGVFVQVPTYPPCHSTRHAIGTILMFPDVISPSSQRVFTHIFIPEFAMSNTSHDDNPPHSIVPSDDQLITTLLGTYDATFDRNMRWVAQGWGDPAVGLNYVSGEVVMPETGNYVMVITSGNPALLLCATFLKNDRQNQEEKFTMDVTLGKPICMTLEKGTRLRLAKTKENTAKGASCTTKLVLYQHGSNAASA
ncbi:hypothetical protein DYB38_010117, partial [Aphanomyces astaci]